MKFIIVAVVAWFVGVFGWSQIIGSLQNLSVRKSLWFTLILWIAIMSGGAYLAIAVFASPWALIAGYVISLGQVFSAGRIQ